MKPLSDYPLATKLRLIIISVVGLLLFLSSTISILYLTYDSYAASENFFKNHAGVVSTNLSAALAFEDEQGAQEVLDTMADDGHITGAMVIDRTRKIVAQLGNVAEIQSKFSSATSIESFGHAGNLRTMFLAVPIGQDREELGFLLVQAEHTEVIDNLVNQFIAMLVILVAMMILAIPIAQLLARSLSYPIVSLMKTMADVSQSDDFSIRAEKKSNDETGYLVDQFNTMLHKVEERDQRLHDYSHDLEKFIEELEKTKEAAIQASEVKSQFLANMSHEIRTPMNGVVGMLDLLKDCTISSEQRDYVEVASRSATGLLSIINDILDLSKIEAGKMTLNPEPIAPGEVIEEVLHIMHQVAVRKNIDLVSLVEPSAYKLYDIDPTRLRQVLLNLIGNAVKFTHAGHVCVECNLVEESGSFRLKVDIKDTGIGISKENHHKLFEAFDQADGSMTRQYGGTGLGLTICRQVVHLMKGHISFESEFNEGSVFSFDVPINRSAEEHGVGPLKALNAGTEMTVAYSISNELLALAVVKLLQCCEIQAVNYSESSNTVFDVVISDDDALRVESSRVIHLVKSHSKKRGNAEADEIVLPLRLSSLRNALQQTSPKPVGGSITSPILLSKAKVLLVEDNMINQMVAEKMLEKFGISCEKAIDGLEALEKTANNDFDLILMDCQMPNMDGFEATVQIRQQQKIKGAAHTPIVALTANAMEEDERRCLEAGMDDYLSKPIESELMGKTLQRWLNA